MIVSCSAWIVATMSRIWPVRARPSSASSGSGTPPGPDQGVGVVEVLVEDVVELAPGENEPPTQAEPERVGERRSVERCRDLGPPVDDHRRAVTVFDVAAPDVPALAGLFVDTAEAQGGGFVLEGGEPQLELPLHGLGVGLVRREHGFVRDSALGPVPHRLEILLREPQTGALERDIRVGHGPKRY